MGIRLHARNPELDPFPIGAACWGYILEHAGLLWPLMFNEARWFAVSGADPRLPREDGVTFYPDILGDSGCPFRITADEARHLARVARNMVEIQRLLPDGGYRQAGWPEPWPRKVRDDWPPIWEAFADWASQSHGFTKGG